MIRFAVLNRARDGLALSASTDMDTSLEIRDVKKYTKILAKKARQFPRRCSMKVGNLRVNFSTESDVCFMMVCEENYAAVLAFSFLDDLQQEFLTQYPKQAIEKVVRPYSFIEFDTFIQKTKQRYNNTRALTVRIDLAEVSEELQRNPPYEITEADLGVQSSSARATVSTKATPTKLVPLSWLGMISCSLSGLCAVLNLIRVVPYISEHGQDPMDDRNWILVGFTLLLAGGVNCFQCYMLLYPLKWRPWMTWIACGTNIMLILMLRDLRNSYQLVFHLTAAVLIAIQTYIRPLQEKLPDYNV